MIKSHVRANWKPAAAATPLIAQRVIKGKFFKNKRVLVHYSKIYWGLGEALSYFKSCPAEKTGPSALMIRDFINSLIP